MKKFAYVAAALLLPASAAIAADPTGEWMVKEKIATIKIEDCGGKLWGVVSWEKQPGGRDVNNPDRAKRSRPTLGMPILLAMTKAGANNWEGQVYNSKDGKTYDAKISLSGPNSLKIEGCVLGFLCAGETWTRVRPEAQQPLPPPGTEKSICTGLAELSGTRRR